MYDFQKIEHINGSINNRTIDIVYHFSLSSVRQTFIMEGTYAYGY